MKKFYNLGASRHWSTLSNLCKWGHPTVWSKSSLLTYVLGWIFSPIFWYAKKPSINSTDHEVSTAHKNKKAEKIKD